MNTESLGDEVYNPGAIGAFFSAESNTISSPYVGKSGVFVFNKKGENSINYPSNMNIYRVRNDKQNQKKVDLLLMNVLKNDKKFVDNRFNFY